MPKPPQPQTFLLRKIRKETAKLLRECKRDAAKVKGLERRLLERMRVLGLMVLTLAEMIMRK